MAIAGTHQTEVTNFDEAWREDVLEETADELLSRQSTESDLFGG